MVIKRLAQGLLLILLVSVVCYSSFRVGVDVERTAGTQKEIDDLLCRIAAVSDAVLEIERTQREIDDLLCEMADVSDDDLINGVPAILQMAEDKKPKENKKATLAKELVSHFKELAACAATPYGPVIAETAMAQRIYFTSASWTEPMASIVFQTEDGHWWKVHAERNADGSWRYDCPSHEDSPLTYDTEATLEVVPPLAGPLIGFPSKRVGIVTRIPKSDG